MTSGRRPGSELRQQDRAVIVGIMERQAAAQAVRCHRCGVELDPGSPAECEDCWEGCQAYLRAIEDRLAADAEARADRLASLPPAPTSDPGPVYRVVQP